MSNESLPVVVPSHTKNLFWPLRDVLRRIWHTCRLLSPKLWSNVAAAGHRQSPSVHCDAAAAACRRYTWHALWGIVLPPLLIQGVDLALGRCDHRIGSIPSSPSLLQRIVASPRELLLQASTAGSSSVTGTSVALASTAVTYTVVNAFSVWKATACIRETGQAMREMMSRRCQAQNLALFAQLCRQGRVIPGLYYDLYLPPRNNNNNNNSSTKAILFLPGAGVEHRAYANPARLLSELGYVVALASAEPLLHMSAPLGFDAAYFRRTCMGPVEEESRYDDYDSRINIDQWFLVGHSMGGFCATQIARDLGLDGLVMWAAAPFVSSLEDLSQSQSIRVAVIQGSNDVMMEWVRKTFQTPGVDLAKAFWAKLPPTAREWVIPQGTHAGFAAYSSKAFPEDDSLLSREAQQEQAVELTHKFLSGIAAK